MINNIAIPCLVVAVVSPNCFYNALVAAPTVTTTITYQDCSTVDVTTGLCLAYAYVSVPTAFDPPFSYNYQCSASLITYYSPAFVSMCMVSTFVTPLAQYTCQWLHKRATPGTYWHRLLDSSLPRMLQTVSENVAENIDKTFVGSGGVMTTLVSTLGIFLTFGIMFPPLCVALAVTVVASVLIFRVNVCRFISSASEQYKESIVKIVESECNSVDTMQILEDSVWILVTVSCCFYTLFLFDTLGDAVGFEKAYWVLIVMPLMPLILYIVYSCLCQYYLYTHHPQVETIICKPELQAGLEMQTTNGVNMEVHNVIFLNENIDVACIRHDAV